MNKLQHFKNIIFSLLLIYIWILYNFFDYYNSLKYSFSMLTLYFNFIYGTFFGIGTGLILILLRLAFFAKKNKLKLKLKNNFFYIFSGIFNLNLFIIWFISIFMRIIDLNLGFINLIFANFFISIFILTDIFLLKNTVESEILESEKIQ